MKVVRSAAIYARISSDPTGSELGVGRQLEDCRKIALAKGWPVAEEYIDNDVSAYSGKKRPEYTRMLDDIRAGARDAVIIYHIDRLTRRPIDLEEFVSICEKSGLTDVVTVTGDMNIGNDSGLLIARIMAAVAADESGTKSRRLRRKQLELAEAGKVSGGGPRPYGYERDRITVISAEAAIIRQMTDRTLSGESARSLAGWLQAERVPTSSGKPWSSETVRSILTSARIAGLRSYHGEIVSTAVWPGIITPEQHRALVAVVEGRALTGRRAPRRYLLSGLLRCGKCGKKLYSAARGDERRYVCLSGPDHGGCGGITVNAPRVEEWISEAVLYRLDSPHMSDALAGRSADQDGQHALIAQRTAAEAKRTELSTIWAAGEITRAEWKAAREPLQHLIDTIDRELSKITGSRALDGMIGGGELRTRWDSLNLERQHAIVAAVLDYATIRPAGAGPFNAARIAPTWTA